MKPVTTENIFEILDGYFTSAALGTAMELGIFWLLAEKPLFPSVIARELDIPLNRCNILLQMLSRLGLLDDTSCGYAPSSLGRKTILEAYSQETWAFLAREARSRLPAVLDLPLNICQPVSTWEPLNQEPPDYLKQLVEEPGYAQRFTRMLYELHIPLAEQLANGLDLAGVKQLLDLGGGSGVMSFAMLRKSPELKALVMDLESVCKIGWQIAEENGLDKRITYLVGDFIKDDLPTGVDMVLLCDTGASTDALFRKIHRALNSNGRFVLVEQFAPNQDHVVPSHLAWAFLSSLEFPRPTINYTTSEAVKVQLQQSGFREISITPLPSKDDLRWNSDWIVLEARK